MYIKVLNLRPGQSIYVNPVTVGDITDNIIVADMLLLTDFGSEA